MDRLPRQEEGVAKIRKHVVNRICVAPTPLAIPMHCCYSVDPRTAADSLTAPSYQMTAVLEGMEEHGVMARTTMERKGSWKQDRKDVEGVLMHVYDDSGSILGYTVSGCVASQIDEPGRSDESCGSTGFEDEAAQIAPGQDSADERSRMSPQTNSACSHCWLHHCCCFPRWSLRFRQQQRRKANHEGYHAVHEFYAGCRSNHPAAIFSQQVGT